MSRAEHAREIREEPARVEPDRPAARRGVRQDPQRDTDERDIGGRAQREAGDGPDARHQHAGNRGSEDAREIELCGIESQAAAYFGARHDRWHDRLV